MPPDAVRERPGDDPPAVAANRRGRSFGEWVDAQSSRLFIGPAVFVILVFSLFPLLVSLYLALSRVRLGAGGFTIKFIGFGNFDKIFFGSQSEFLLGRLGAISTLGWVFAIAVVALIAYWLFRYLRAGRIWVPGLIGRAILASTLIGLAFMTAATVLSGRPMGALGVTLYYVVVGCSIQFVIGLGLALLCSMPIRGRSFFRLVFFIPLMVTPVGIAYTFRMLADLDKGPLSPFWVLFGLEEVAWAANAWSARLVVIIGDSWQWIPFIFVVMLAAIENLPRDQVEAAQVDGASGWQIFREITWPSIVPVAATVMLIRVIEAFKIIDLPNVLTNGGPGTATRSMTLESFFLWRAITTIGESTAIAYTLLFITVVMCVSFFNLIVLKNRERAA